MSIFAERAYDLLRQVPRGRVTTYREIAHALGTKAYRAVGRAMRNNPYAPKVPCHRVVFASGKIGGFNGETSGNEIQRKIEILKNEGVEVKVGKVNDFEKVLFTFFHT